ncbi:MAG: hypothetical protein M0Q88_05895 [Bacilli bacterium]|nr:hypothetical protein [Bacilli bacterium]
MEKERELLRLCEGGKTFTETTMWVKEYDEGVYGILEKMMERFVKEINNSTSETDLEEFQKGSWLVEYTLTTLYQDTLEIMVTCGKDMQDIANQPDWLKDTLSLESLKKGSYFDVNIFLEKVK